MTPYFVVTLIVIASIIADYLLKVSATRADSLSSAHFWAGALLYAVTAFGWMLAMKHLSLAAIGVYYSLLTLLLLTLLGVFVFKEALTVREVIGIALAIGSITLMTKFS